MDNVFDLLGGALVVVVIPLALFLAVVIPVWALIDLLRRDDDPTTRVLWGLLIVFCLGGVGSILYALVGSRSSALRRAAVIGLVGVPVLFITAALSLQTAEQMREPAAGGGDPTVDVTAMPELPTIDPSGVGTFVAARPAEGARAYQVGVFDLRGPDESTLRPVDTACDWVALDTRRQQHYCASWRGVTVVDLERELTTRLPDDDDNFAHLAGIVYDEPRDRVLVTANTGAGGFVFAYSPSEGRWRELFELNTHARALAASAEADELYVIPKDASFSRLSSVHRYNLEGASLGEILLDPPLPLGERGPGSGDGEIQLVWSGDWLVVVLTEKPERGQSILPVEMFAIEQASGKVYALANEGLR